MATRLALCNFPLALCNLIFFEGNKPDESEGNGPNMKAEPENGSQKRKLEYLFWVPIFAPMLPWMHPR